jgi:hypothetical protein
MEPDNAGSNRNEDGTFKKGMTGNPNGRPKTISIKDAIRKRLEAHPEEVEEIVKHFVEKNRELMWTMLEGSPKQTSEVKSSIVKLTVTGEDLLLAQQLRERRELKRGPTGDKPSDGADTDSVGGEVPNQE